MKFIHRFSRTLQVEVTLTDEKPPAGQHHVVRVEWIGQPKRKYLAEYRQWMLHVQQLACDRWQCSLLYALGTKCNETEFWAFEPDKPPKLLEKAPVGIP